MKKSEKIAVAAAIGVVAGAVITFIISSLGKCDKTANCCADRDKKGDNRESNAGGQPEKADN